MNHTAIRVLIVDDHRIVREGIRALLSEFEDIQVVGEAGSGQEGVNLVPALQPHVILMDLVMPGMDGIEATRRITAAAPAARVLVLTSFLTADRLYPAIKAGALGYLLKDTSSVDLVEAIRQVDRGEPSLPPEIAHLILSELRQPAPGLSPGPDALTDREVEVLRLVGQGKTNREIAAKLSVSPETARGHVNNILSKLHVANRVQATLYALREGISSLDDSE
ncbi:MAG: response regulator transcription factor [Caldilineaceae bacterium]